MVLLSVVHTKSDGSSCVKMINKSLREEFKPCLHLCPLVHQSAIVGSSVSGSYGRHRALYTAHAFYTYVANHLKCKNK